MRFCQWMQTIGSTQSAWANRPIENNPSWFGHQFVRSSYAGQATQTVNDYTGTQHVAGNPTAWTHGMQIQIAIGNDPSFKAMTGITANGSTTTIGCTSHGYSNGDKIFTRVDYSITDTGGVSAPAWVSGTSYSRGAIVSASRLFFCSDERHHNGPNHFSRC